MKLLEYSRRLRAFWWRPPLDDEVRDELDFHVDMRVRELVAKGVPPAEARVRARARLGNLNQVRAAMRRQGRRRDRRMRRASWLEDVRQDLVYGARALLRHLGFSLVAAVTLAVGIGGTTAIFSAVWSVVLRPLPFPDPDQIYVVAYHKADDNPYSTSVGNYTDMKREQTGFSAYAAASWSNLNLAEGDTPERVLAARVTWDYFSVFGVAPAVGRAFGAADDQAGAPPVVLLSHRLWTRRFGADPGVIGRSIRLNEVAREVVGVMPAAFDLTDDSEELWVPAAFTPEELAEHDSHYMAVYARLKPGVTPEQARVGLERTLLPLVDRYPNANGGITGLRLIPLHEQFVGNARQQLLVLLGAVGFVLLIACVNVANLLMARGATRAREIAVRASLGAGRGRIVRQLVTENVLLALVSGGLGVGVAFGALRALVAASPEGVPRLSQAAIDGPTLIFALAVSLVSALFFGLAPAFGAARSNLQQALREGGRGAEGGGREWFRRGLVAVEVAVAIVLLVGTGLLIRTAIHLQRVDPGFDPAGVMTARVTLPPDAYPDWDRVTATFSRIHEELARAPGVARAGLSSQVPMGPGGGSNGLIPEGRPLTFESSIKSRLRLVTPGFLATMGIPLIDGRDFTVADRRGSPRVMIVSQALARRAWPGQSPIGKRIVCCEGSADDPAWKTVVGVAAAVRAGGIDQEAGPEFYLPIRQAPPGAWDWVQRTMTLAARGDGGEATLTEAMRGAVRAIDPSLPIYSLATMDQRVARSLARSRFNTGVLTVLGGLGLGLAAIGIYGVIAYFVTRRTREIGVRMALGASPSGIVRLVMRQGLAPVVAGIVIGVAGALVATRVLESQLRGVGRADPVTFVAVTGVALAVAVAATLGPARRAIRTDSLAAMREE